jgi:hypothetical protein
VHHEPAAIRDLHVPEAFLRGLGDQRLSAFEAHAPRAGPVNAQREVAAGKANVIAALFDANVGRFELVVEIEAGDAGLHRVMVPGLHADDIRHRRRHADVDHRAFEPIHRVLGTAVDAPYRQRVALAVIIDGPLHARRGHAFRPQPAAVSELHTTLTSTKPARRATILKARMKLSSC